VTVTGNPTGGSVNSSYGIYNVSTGAVWINGNIIPGTALGAHGVYNSSTGYIGIVGTSHTLQASGSGASQGTLGLYSRLAAIQFGENLTIEVPNAADNASATNPTYKAGVSYLYGTSLAQGSGLAAADVRYGTNYSTPSGPVTGTCQVPAAASVLYGVPVDNTTGTAQVTITGVGDVDGYTLEEALKLILAAVAGKASKPVAGQIIYRAADDSKDRITATVNQGERSAVTLDATG